MRILFSLAGLLIVLAIVAWLARTQLKTVTSTVAPSPATGAQAPTVPEQSRQLQRQIQQDIGRALEQGAQRASESQP
jgi:hypothetical protein